MKKTPLSWVAPIGFGTGLMCGASALHAADVEEPDFPAKISNAIECPAPDVATPNQDLQLRCVPRSDLQFAKFVLSYRASGEEEFTRSEMRPTNKGWYAAVVPAQKLHGKMVHFYFEALDKKDKVVASDGRNESPNLLSLRDANAAKATVSAQDGDDNPLLASKAAHDASDLDAQSPRAFWFGLAMGSGYGWHSEQTLESNQDLRAGAGMTAVGPAHVAPELGWQFDAATSISLQGRWQFIPKQGDGTGNITNAVAVLARLNYALMDLGAFRVYASGIAGGGSGFRLVIPARAALGVPNGDTVRGGPFVAGAGLGVVYSMTTTFGIGAEVNALVGAPNIAATVDLNAGVRARF